MRCPSLALNGATLPARCRSPGSAMPVSSGSRGSRDRHRSQAGRASASRALEGRAPRRVSSTIQPPVASACRTYDVASLPPTALRGCEDAVQLKIHGGWSGCSKRTRVALCRRVAQNTMSNTASSRMSRGMCAWGGGPRPDGRLEQAAPGTRVIQRRISGHVATTHVDIPAGVVHIRILVYMMMHACMHRRNKAHEARAKNFVPPRPQVAYHIWSDVHI